MLISLIKMHSFVSELASSTNFLIVKYSFNGHRKHANLDRNNRIFRPEKKLNNVNNATNQTKNTVRFCGRKSDKFV